MGSKDLRGSRKGHRIKIFWDANYGGWDIEKEEPILNPDFHNFQEIEGGAIFLWRRILSDNFPYKVGELPPGEE